MSSLRAGARAIRLYVYDSKLHAWSIKLVSLDQHQQLQQPEGCFLHFNSKVIPIGEAGTMAFVDLWRCILLWDALTGNPKLRYATLPPPILPGWESRGDARLSRDIAVVYGRIKYAELQINWKPVLTKNHRYTFDGWTARAWSRPAMAAADSS
ncbi:hypothetical protein ACP70R_035860 [Stipagrostis hirtigluma subsp. patula]